MEPLLASFDLLEAVNQVLLQLESWGTQMFSDLVFELVGPGAALVEGFVDLTKYSGNLVGGKVLWDS